MVGEVDVAEEEDEARAVLVVAITGSTRVPTEVEAVVVVVEETAWVETDLEEVVDDLDSVVEAVAVDGLDLQELVEVAVVDPLAQIPGGDRNNQNCTADKNCGAWPSSQRWPKMCAFSVAPVAETVPELHCCH